MDAPKTANNWYKVELNSVHSDVPRTTCGLTARQRARSHGSARGQSRIGNGCGDQDPRGGRQAGEGIGLPHVHGLSLTGPGREAGESIRLPHVDGLGLPACNLLLKIHPEPLPDICPVASPTSVG
ncbi:unnamed protein product [Parajaminaea phylloscopi]